MVQFFNYFVSSPKLTIFSSGNTILFGLFDFLASKGFYVIWLSSLLTLDVPATWCRFFQRQVFHSGFDIYIYFFDGEDIFVCTRMYIDGQDIFVCTQMYIDGQDIFVCNEEFIRI